MLPKYGDYHDKFMAFGGMLVEATGYLHKAVTSERPDFTRLAAEMEAYEQKADRLGVELFTKLHKSFMTPYDPEDIFSLIHYLDDVMDGLEDIAHRFSAYGLEKADTAMCELARLICEAAQKIEEALKMLAHKGDVVTACFEIAKSESAADDVSRKAIAALFANEHDAILLIKKKEIYEYFERTADATKKVATILGRIQVKGG
jgi:uncharacterized protein Yka (UPF0111/DUF47 family)